MARQNLITTIKEYKDLWFIIPILIYAFSFLSEYYYYNYFNLNIIYYLSATDLIFSFANKVVGTFVVGFIVYICSFLIIELFRPIKAFAYIVICLASGILLALNARWGQTYKEEISIVTAISLYYFAIKFIVVGYSISNATPLSKNRQIRFLQFTILIGLLFAMKTILIKSQITQITGAGKHMEFNYDGHQIISNKSTRIYIGETSNFIFLYNIFKEATTVYKKEVIITQIISDAEYNNLFDSTEYLHDAVIQQRKLVNSIITNPVPKNFLSHPDSAY